MSFIVISLMYDDIISIISILIAKNNSFTLARQIKFQPRFIYTTFIKNINLLNIFIPKTAYNIIL